MKHVSAEARLREKYRLFSHRQNAFFAQSEVLYDFPGIIGAAGIDSVNRVRPFEQMIKKLSNDVGLVADG